MADGCISNIVKYLLFITNFLIFVLGIAVLGCGIWVLVDKPSFLDLFEQAEQNVPSLDGKFDVSLYTSAAYIIIVVAALITIISFFGCFGAIKESKCMLGTYFVLILAMFIVMVVGAVLGYTGDLENTLRKPLKEAMNKYDDSADKTDEKAFAYKTIWNNVQAELQCCGVDNVTDWRNGNYNFKGDVKQPDGCCHFQKKGDGFEDIWGTGETAGDNDQVRDCKKSDAAGNDSIYKFNGCFTKIKDKIEDNQDIVVGVAIGVVVVMFLNMLFSFAMCTMVN